MWKQSLYLYLHRNVLTGGGDRNNERNTELYRKDCIMYAMIFFKEISLIVEPLSLPRTLVLL